MNKQGDTLEHGEWQGHLGQGFSLRQLQAFLGLANDLAPKQIADLMHIKPETVSNHMAAVMYKTRCHKAAGALAKLIKQGVITPLAIALFCLGLLGMVSTAASTQQPDDLARHTRTTRTSRTTRGGRYRTNNQRNDLLPEHWA